MKCDVEMKDKFFKYLFSNQLMAILFVAFSTAMAFGTFIESWYSTDTAKIWIYNAWWFELILALFMVNFFGNIFKYRLLRKEKLLMYGHTLREKKSFTPKKNLRLIR